MSLITVSREQFKARFEKAKTKKMVDCALLAWDKYLRHMHSDEPSIILRFRDNEREKYSVLDHMIQTWKKNKSLATMRSYFQYTKSWLKYNDIPFDDDKIKEFIRFPKPVKSRGRGIDKNIIELLYKHSNEFYRDLLLVEVCTGIRITGILAMRPSWIDFNHMPPKVTVPGEHAKAGVEYITFLTPSVAQRILKRCQGDDVIFNVSYSTYAAYMSKLRKKLNLTEKEPNGKFHIVRIHKFRSYTLNRLSRSVGSEFAHAILGHGEDVGKYFHDGMSDEEAGQDYLKGVESITINDNRRDNNT